jgi:hypothetical protein
MESRPMILRSSRSRSLVILSLVGIALGAAPQKEKVGQPTVTPGPNEPDWVAILDAYYGLRMKEDLVNPVTSTREAVPGLFLKAGPGPVVYTPLIALGLETINRGGWYTSGATPGEPERRELWSYQFKNTGDDLEKGVNMPPPLKDGSKTEFDPGDRPFGLWVANDGLKDGGVFTEPAVVAAVNQRLKGQPYKAMIYPVRDPKTGAAVPNSYLIGWEYSTNDDFQDVVCRVDNATLIPVGR